MSEFGQIMKGWKRLCDSMTNEYGEMESCNRCPLDPQGGCAAIFEIDDAFDNWDHIKSIVEKWVADNPEPKYPTWAQYLKEQGILEINCVPTLRGGTTSNPSPLIQTVKTTPAFYRPISDDIAKKLGLNPINEVKK